MRGDSPNAHRQLQCLKLLQPFQPGKCRQGTPGRQLLAALAAWLLLWANAPAHAATLTGVVQRVIDGDSFFLDRPGQPSLPVRISNIDAPEICQAWGAEAKAALEALVLNQTVTARTGTRDRQGRTWARVRVGQLDVGERLVSDGHAWSARGRNGRGPALKQERVAASLRRGLHDSTGAEFPADFRERHGPCAAADMAR
jgi:endonuclease YncB( thermonuclease family)